MSEENLWELLMAALSQMAQDVVLLLPKILIALIVFVIAFLMIKVLNISIKKILKFVELEKIVGRFQGFALPISLNSLVIFLVDFGIALIAIYLVTWLFLGSQYIQMVTEVLRYGTRIVSILVVAIFLFSVFGLVINKIRVETRLRGYIWFIIILLIIAMLMDITALSDPVKNALITGLSVGIGISIGIFAIWFFFHDYLDKMLKIRDRTSDATAEEKR